MNLREMITLSLSLFLIGNVAALVLHITFFILNRPISPPMLSFVFVTITSIGLPFGILALEGLWRTFDYVYELMESLLRKVGWRND